MQCFGCWQVVMEKGQPPKEKFRPFLDGFALQKKNFSNISKKKYERMYSELSLVFGGRCFRNGYRLSGYWRELIE
jgi:hypothetical protein